MLGLVSRHIRFGTIGPARENSLSLAFEVLPNFLVVSLEKTLDEIKAFRRKKTQVLEGNFFFLRAFEDKKHSCLDIEAKNISIDGAVTSI